jgi:hypothetical protein
MSGERLLQRPILAHIHGTAADLVPLSAHDLPCSEWLNLNATE